MEIGKITPLPSSVTSVSLDKLADDITEAIYTTYNESGRHSFGHNRRNAWWNDTCKVTRHEYMLKIRQNISLRKIERRRNSTVYLLRKQKKLIIELE